MKKTSGVIFILLASLLFGSYGVWSRLIGSDMGVFYQAWSRGLIIALVFFPIIYFRKLLVPIKRDDWGWMAVFLVSTSLTQAPLFYAFNHMDIGSATLLFFVSMLLTMYLVGFFFLGEKLSIVKICSFFLACIGMYTIYSFSLAAFALLAAVMAILNGIASGSEVSFSKKISNSYSPLYLSWLSWVAIVVTNLALSLLVGETQLVPSLQIIWFWQICYAIVNGLAFWLILKGLKYVEATTGGLLGLLEIIFGIGFGIIIFHEKLTLQIAIGALLILIAAALPHAYELYSKKYGTSKALPIA